MIVEYTGPFIQAFGALESFLKEEVLARIEEFKDLRNHRRLKVHKLHGRLKGRYSFSVNYRYRVIFTYPEKGVARLHAVGDHDIYE